MAVQTTVSNLASIFGSRISAANEMHKDKPVDKGFQRLPGGMRNAIAKLQVMEVAQNQDDKKWPGAKGKHYFRAAAVVVFSGNVATPHEHDGIKVLNMQTSQFVDLCDTPEVKFPGGTRPASSYEQNAGEMINILKMFGMKCPYTPKDDPTGQKTWMYYVACMKEYTDPQKPAKYVSFSTSKPWKKKRPNESDEQFNNREGSIFETWHDGTEWKGITNPADNVNVVTSNGVPAMPVTTQPHPHDNPPEVGADGLPLNPNYTAPELVIPALVQQALADNREAQLKLNELADANGWSKDQIEDENLTWEDVGRMALTSPDEAGTSDAPEVTVGSKWNYVKRDNNGTKLMDEKKQILPSKEVEVTSVDMANKTCTVREVKTGKDVTGLRSKTPTVIKFEWLE